MKKAFELNFWADEKAIINNPNRRSEPYNISTKINSRKNYELARIIGGEESTVLYFGDMLSRIDAQTCLQSGLANVFLELVNFDGDEIYFTHESSLENRTFREAVLSYDTSSIIGIERASEIILSPNFDEIIQAGDKIISISEDDDKVLKDGINLPDSGLYNENNLIRAINKDDKVERVFVLGSSEDDLSKIRVLSKNLMKYLDSGSEIFLVNDREDTKALLEEIENKNHLVFNHILGDIRSRDFLNTLDLRNGDKINQVSNSKSFKSEVKFYLRVSVIDKVGILSDLTSIFKTFKISIETIYQDLQKGNQVANLIIFTHNVKRTQMEKAVLKINKLKGTVGNALAFCIYN